MQTMHALVMRSLAPTHPGNVADIRGSGQVMTGHVKNDEEEYKNSPNQYVRRCLNLLLGRPALLFLIIRVVFGVHGERGRDTST